MLPVKIHRISNPEKWMEGLGKYDSSIFITNTWLNSVATNNEVPVYLDFTNREKTVAKIGGLAVRNRKKNPDILYFYSGIAFKSTDKDLIKSCYYQLIQYAKENKFDRLIIKSYGYNEDFSFRHPGLVIDRIRSEFLVDITPDENIILSKFNKTARKHIRRAGKTGSKVYESTSPEVLELLIRFLEITYERRLAKGYSQYNIFHHRNFKKESLQHLLQNGIGTMFYVITNNEINSILYALIYGQKAFLFLIGTTEKGYDLHSPVFLEYHSILQLKKRGFDFINLGGIPYHPSHKGLIQYKKSLGAYSITLADQSTYFLLYPLKFLNPLLYIHDHLPEKKFLIIIKKILRKFVKLFIIFDDD